MDLLLAPDRNGSFGIPPDPPYAREHRVLPAMLEEQLRRALDRRREGGTLRGLRCYDTTSTATGKASGVPSQQQPALVDFSSNDYIGLARSADLRRAFMDKMQGVKGRPLGSTGSRLLDGNSSEYEELEARLAAHFRAPAALLFNSGYDANASLLSVVPQENDYVLYDELVHASMHDGMRMSRVQHRRRIPFKHNDVHNLTMRLTDITSSKGFNVEAGKEAPNVFIAVESVYSMDGDLCPVSEIVGALNASIVRERRCLIVDEAHGVGLYGRRGAGLAEELGIADQIDLRLATFGKAFGSSGAAVLCTPLVREYLVNYARPLIYSTALPYSTLRLIDAALDLLSLPNGSLRAAKTFSLTQAFIEELEGAMKVVSQDPTQRREGKRDDAQPRILSRLPELVGRSGADAGRQPSMHCSRGNAAGYGGHRPASAPIVPVLTSRPRELAAHLVAHGFLVRPITYPTVPRGSERVRICIHAHNELNEVTGLARCIATWAASVTADTNSPQESCAQAGNRLDGTATSASPSDATKAKL